MMTQLNNSLNRIWNTFVWCDDNITALNPSWFLEGFSIRVEGRTDLLCKHIYSVNKKAEAICYKKSPVALKYNAMLSLLNTITKTSWFPINLIHYSILKNINQTRMCFLYNLVLFGVIKKRMECIRGWIISNRKTWMKGWNYDHIFF